MPELLLYKVPLPCRGPGRPAEHGRRGAADVPRALRSPAAHDCLLSPQNFLLLGGGAQLLSSHFWPKWKRLNPVLSSTKGQVGDKAQACVSLPTASTQLPSLWPQGPASPPEHTTSAGSPSGKTMKCLKTPWWTPGSSQQSRQQTATRHVTSRSGLAGRPPPKATGSQGLQPEGRHR